MTTIDRYESGRALLLNRLQTKSPEQLEKLALRLNDLDRKRLLSLMTPDSLPSQAAISTLVDRIAPTPKKITSLDKIPHIFLLIREVGITIARAFGLQVTTSKEFVHRLQDVVISIDDTEESLQEELAKLKEREEKTLFLDEASRNAHELKKELLLTKLNAVRHNSTKIEAAIERCAEKIEIKTAELAQAEKARWRASAIQNLSQKSPKQKMEYLKSQLNLFEETLFMGDIRIQIAENEREQSEKILPFLKMLAEMINDKAILTPEQIRLLNDIIYDYDSSLFSSLPPKDSLPEGTLCIDETYLKVSIWSAEADIRADNVIIKFHKRDLEKSKTLIDEVKHIIDNFDEHPEILPDDLHLTYLVDIRPKIELVERLYNERTALYAQKAALERRLREISS